MKNNKEMSLEELEHVSGGRDTLNEGEVMCIKCFTTFKKDENLVSHSSGCDEETYIKCPNCGHEWQ